MMIKRLLVIIGIGLLFASFVDAQETGRLGLSVAPQIFELDVFPGETRNEKIIVGNLSKVAVPVSVRVTDFTAEEDSGEMLFDESSQDPSFASRFWFKIENPNLILEPDERREVRFSISVPEDAEPGGHYAVMLFVPQLPSFYFKEGQSRAIPVVGVLFLISVKTLALEPISIEKPIEIAEFKIPEEQRIQILEKAIAGIFQVIPGVLAAEINIVEKTPSSFILKIKNNDIFHHKLSGKLLIYNSFGKLVGETEIKRTTILPGKTRKFQADFSLPRISENLKWLPASVSNFLVQNTSLGKYRVILELGEAKSQIELNQTLNFWAFPWKIILIFSLILIFLILIRKRIISAIKILITPKAKLP